MSCNNILSHSSDLFDLVQLLLHESYALPSLTYSTSAFKFSETQIASLNICWNSVFRRNFHFNRWESVKFLFVVYVGLISGLQLSTKLYLSNFVKTLLLEKCLKPLGFKKVYKILHFKQMI